MYTRADFPHDNWWEKATVTFSDGTQEILELRKGGEAQIFNIHKDNIEWLELSELIKADDPSPFPALTQLQVYGSKKCRKSNRCKKLHNRQIEERISHSETL